MFICLSGSSWFVHLVCLDLFTWFISICLSTRSFINQFHLYLFSRFILICSSGSSRYVHLVHLDLFCRFIRYLHLVHLDIFISFILICLSIVVQFEMLILICSSISFRSVHLAHLDLLIWSTWFVVHPDLVHFDLIIWFTSICSSDSLYTVIYVQNNLTVCIQLYMFRTIWDKSKLMQPPSYPPGMSTRGETFRTF